MERLHVDNHTSLLGPSDVSYKENEVLENDSSALAIKLLFLLGLWMGPINQSITKL